MLFRTSCVFRCPFFVRPQEVLKTGPGTRQGAILCRKRKRWCACPGNRHPGVGRQCFQGKPLNTQARELCFRVGVGSGREPLPASGPVLAWKTGSATWTGKCSSFLGAGSGNFCISIRGRKVPASLFHLLPSPDLPPSLCAIPFSLRAPLLPPHSYPGTRGSPGVGWAVFLG